MLYPVQQRNKSQKTISKDVFILYIQEDSKSLQSAYIHVQDKNHVTTFSFYHFGFEDALFGSVASLFY